MIRAHGATILLYTVFPEPVLFYLAGDPSTMADSVDTTTHEQRWTLSWRCGSGRTQPLTFELDRGYCYRVVVTSEEDKNTFLDMFLRPPETALVAPDGGLLGNLKIDENILLPLGYHGIVVDSVQQRIVALFHACGLDEDETLSLLLKVPGQLSLYQRRLAGFVRAALGNPRVMVYDSIWDGVSMAEVEHIGHFDDYFRRHAPAHTAVFVGYDTQLNVAYSAHDTYRL
ncbi:MAG: hypothetical protein IPM27_03210 [Nitrosomonadales bacterium]|nr:hypothetical protein [Nitrosomonadales bacterium]